MRNRRYGRKRQWRFWILACAVLLFCGVLVSCMAGSGMLFAGGVILDVSAMSEEATIRELSTEGVLATRLSETVLGAASGSIRLSAFRGADRGRELYREAMLWGLLSTGYSSYVGNRSLISRAEAAYPHTSFVTLIPAKDLETRSARCFGGSTTHGDAGAFVYLSRVEMYTTAAPHASGEINVTVIKLEETESYYRMHFSLTDRRGETASYQALFEKKEDGSFIWSALYEQ